MSEKFRETITVASKEEKSGKKGIYFALKTDKNLVFNIGADSLKFGPISVGKTYSLEGVVLDPQPGYTHGSRWINTYSEIAQGNATQMQKETDREPVDPPKNAYEIQQNGVKFGNRLSNAVALVVAQIEKGVVKPTNEEIDIALDKVFASFDRAEKTGKFEAPF